MTELEHYASLLRIHGSANLAAQPEPMRREQALLNLSSNELHHPGFDLLFRQFLERCAKVDEHSQYPAIEECARELERSLSLPRHSVTIAPGSDPAIRAVTEAFSASLCMVAPTPCYRAYMDYSAAFGMRFMGIDALRDPEDMFVSKLVAEIRKSAPCVVVLTDPDGITGRRWESSTVAEIRATCLSHDSLLIIDSAYAGFSPASSEAAPVSGEIRIRSLSKSHGAAGLRLAYVTATPNLCQHVAKTRIANGISRLALMYLAFTRHEAAAFATLARDIERWRIQLEDTVRQIHPDWVVPSSHGNFVFFDMRRASEAQRIQQRFRAAGIRARWFEPGTYLSTCMRLTVPEPRFVDRVLGLLS